MHYYPGLSGEYRLRRYLGIMCDYLKDDVFNYSLTLLVYQSEKNSVLKLEEMQVLLKLVNVKIITGGRAYGELPSIDKMIDAAQEMDENDWIFYTHVKGSSYLDKEIYLKHSMNNLQFILEAINHSNFSFIDKQFEVLGCDLAMGVFERFGSMHPHFAGNFFACKVRAIRRHKKFGSKFYSITHRHLAEKFISESVPIEKFFNLNTHYLIDPNNIISSFQKEKFKQKMESLKMFSKENYDNLKVKNIAISNFYFHKQQRYSKNRPFWNVYRLFFGNYSLLRKFKTIRFVLDKLLPWYNCELYRYNLLPSSFELLENSNKVTLK